MTVGSDPSKCHQQLPGTSLLTLWDSLLAGRRAVPARPGSWGLLASPRASVTAWHPGATALGREEGRPCHTLDLKGQALNAGL